MELINRESKTTVHLSVQYLLAGSWRPERARTVEFEKALLDNGLDFGQTQSRDNAFMLTRPQPSHLQVRIESPNPQVVSLLTLANNPQYECQMFGRDAEAVARSFLRTWPARQYQVLTVNCKIHHLYSATVHAFKYLWEERLGQAREDFRLLGNRPVAGGGLRLVMPPHAAAGGEPTSIQVRIESFLKEPKKIFIETAFSWPKPWMTDSEKGFDPTRYIEQTEQFAAEEVWNFLTRPEA